jgi:hypothetical protein
MKIGHPPFSPCGGFQTVDVSLLRKFNPTRQRAVADFRGGFKRLFHHVQRAREKPI